MKRVLGISIEIDVRKPKKGLRMMNTRTSLWFQEVQTIIGISSAVSVTMASQFLISMVETIYVSRLGVVSLAGLTLGLGIYLVFFIAVLGFATAVTPFAASCYAQGEMDRVGEYGRQMMIICAALSVIAAIVMNLIIIFFPLTNLTYDVLKATREYLVPASCGLPAWVMYVGVRSYSNTINRSLAVTIVMLVSVPAYALGGAVAIFGIYGSKGGGVFGAGIAYALTGWFALMISLGSVSRASDKRDLRLLRGGFRPNCRMISDLLRFGGPLSLRIMLREGVLPIAGFAMISFGATAIASYAVASRILELSSVLAFGIGDAAIIRVSKFYTERKSEELRQAVYILFVLTILISCCGSFAIFNLRYYIANNFIGEAPSTSLESVAFALRYIAVIHVLDSFVSTFNGILAGFRDNVGPFLVCFAGMWVIGLSSCSFLAYFTPLSSDGIYIGLILGFFATVSAYSVRLWMIMRSADLSYDR